MKKITFIGAGNLATHLGRALRTAGCQVCQVFSRTEDSAVQLANILNAEPLTDLRNLKNDADIYIISVKDSIMGQLIPSVCKGRMDKIFLHTAGSMPISCFEGQAKYYGVFYPMQTFSKKRDVDFSHIPVFIEGSSEETTAIIASLADRITDRVIPLSSSDRKYLHLAAVWACNFSNFCFDIASEILESHNIPFEVMLPLVDETVRKIHTISPCDAQTGPAVRYDENVMGQQLDLLSSRPDLQKLYRLLSDGIHKRCADTGC